MILSLSVSHVIFKTGLLLSRPSGSFTSVVIPSIFVTALLIVSRYPSHFFHFASWSMLNHVSTAASTPIISSRPTLLSRPGPWCGELACQADINISFLPSSKPPHCGPHNALPPLYATMSAPACRWMLGTVRSSAAASTSTGTFFGFAILESSSSLNSLLKLIR